MSLVAAMAKAGLKHAALSETRRCGDPREMTSTLAALRIQLLAQQSTTAPTHMAVRSKRPGKKRRPVSPAVLFVSDCRRYQRGCHEKVSLSVPKEGPDRSECLF
jgi:hypothetical protein